MILFEFEFLLVLIVITFCIILLYIYGRQPGHYWSKVGVPSPPSTLFIGHMDKLFDPKTGFCYNFDKWRDEYGPIFGVLFFRDPVLVVRDIDAVKEVLVKDFNNYVDRYIIGYDSLWKPIMKKGLFFNKGHDWRRIRKILSPCFSTGKLKFLTRHINTTSSQLVRIFHKHVEDGTLPEAKMVFSAYSLDALACSAFGLDLDSHNNLNGSFYQHAKGMMNFTPIIKVITGVVGIFPCLGFIFKMLDIGFIEAKHVIYFKQQLTKLVMERKADPDKYGEGDFLQFLINAEADPSDETQGSKTLKTDEIVAQCIIFVLAGYETTSAALQWVSYELAKRKDIQNKLIEEIDEVLGAQTEVTNEHCQKLKYMDAVIHEALRMYPAVIDLSRLAERTTTLKGFTVPAGVSVVIPVANICRDPEIFEEPNSFNPERFMEESKVSTLLTSLPFGFGPRQCIGMRLALLQLKIALVHVLRDFSIDDTVPRSVGIDDFSGLIQPKETIRLVLSKRNV